MKEVEILLPKALEAVQSFLVTSESSQIVQKEYDGYAASLGASIRTSGLIAALVFYTDVKRSDAEASRYKLLKAIAHTLGMTISTKSDKDKKVLLEKVLREAYGQNIFDRNLNRDGNLPTITDPNTTVIKEWTKKITNASIALKLAMRNFKHSD
jgi:CRISPR/Cas system CMR-associated protein Cmr5 small subunit